MLEGIDLRQRPQQGGNMNRKKEPRKPPEVAAAVLATLLYGPATKKEVRRRVEGGLKLRGYVDKYVDAMHDAGALYIHSLDGKGYPLYAVQPSLRARPDVKSLKDIKADLPKRKLHDKYMVQYNGECISLKALAEALNVGIGFVYRRAKLGRTVEQMVADAKKLVIARKEGPSFEVPTAQDVSLLRVGSPFELGDRIGRAGL